ncbi:ornithine cyclodeaminase family protein [Novipirellula artificiosorum]|uniref:L-lysine cyclodeaminase n=1 Tax=Novipirellula artificiosorum TaxID=2528016 RepID=A0A5C6DHT0_9BACT|nr:ornithine cyclodeaminase family protein [Novipirellula artificiosorum]TWU36112.1 L-lysine cyclodeaminase [Novipirellula artificiosorum]
MQVRMLSGADVAELLSMAEAIRLMRTAFAALSAGRAVMPMRSCVDFQNGDIHMMPAALDGGDICVKLVATFRGNRQHHLPVVQGLLTLTDGETGTPRAVMNCGPLTAIRTGAAGGLAIDVLSRQDSEVLGVIGAGVQARMQIEAGLCVRDFRQVILYDRDVKAAQTLRQLLLDRPNPPEVTIAADSQQAAKQADVLITATTSASPTFEGAGVRPGTHINAVGAYRPDVREVDDVLVERAYVVTDSREACQREAGDLIIPGCKGDAELGDILNGVAEGRSDDEQVTFFKSVGLAIQDAVVASWLLKQAEEHEIGSLIEL